VCAIIVSDRNITFNMVRGRPRSFDLDDAIENAMVVFCSKEYDNPTITDLTNPIRMNHPTIRPDVAGTQGRAPAVDAPTLKRWLDQGHDDEGRPVVTLDTRNGFEVDFGTFEGAIDWRLDKFSAFPDQLLAHKNELQGKTVVSFCTGGIRCEKAALFMEEAGLDHVYQLDGGILKYFELAGGAHYQGTCFVFDEREALGANLAPEAGLIDA